MVPLTMTKNKGKIWLLGTVYGLYVIIINLIPFNTTIKLSTSILLLLIIYFIISGVTVGIRNTIIFLILSYVITFLIEHTSIYYGVPFGYYVYTSSLGPTLLGVPIIIPLIWTSILFICYELGGALFGPLFAVFIDIGFDPRFSQTLWHWITPGQYYGVPISNFIGWYITASIVIVIYYMLFENRIISDGNILTLLTYVLFGIGNAIADYRIGLYAVIIPMVLYIATLLIMIKPTYYIEQDGDKNHANK